MEIKTMSADELIERRAAIATELDAPEADLDALEAENPDERGEEPVFYQESAALQDKNLSKKIIPIGRLNGTPKNGTAFGR